MKPGRNEACACGSGRKYKKCCGQGAPAAPAVASRLPGEELEALAAMLGAGRHAEVEIRARELTGRHPESGIVWKILGLSQWLQGRDALTALRRAAQLLPGDPEAQGNLGNALRAAGQFEEAVASQRRAIALQPNRAEAHNNLGSALLGLEQIEEAERCFRRAFAIDPQFALAHRNLAELLQRLGRYEEAVTSFRRALALGVGDAALHNGLGNALYFLKQFAAAAEAYERAVAIAPRYAEAHNNLGNVRRDQGQLTEAIASYRLALDLSPDSAEIHNNLGNVLLDHGKPLAAREHYVRALELRPDFAKAHSNLGSAYRELGSFDAAEASYRASLALQADAADVHNNLAVILRLQGRTAEAEERCRHSLVLNPNSAAAWSFLADLHSDRGRFAEAEELFQRALAIDPDWPQAWAGIAGLRKMSAADEPWLAQAQRLAGAVRKPRDEMVLRFALGKYFDDARDFDQAFDNYRRANEIAKSGREPHDRERLTRITDYTMSLYDRSWVVRSRSAAARSALPILVVGTPRSGTTLAERIFAAHPSGFGAGELPFWKTASAAIAAGAGEPHAQDALLASSAQQYLQLLTGLAPTAARIVDKMPGNYGYLGPIHAALPNARIIHMQRNPVDSCLSIYFQNFHGAHTYANDLGDLAHYYREYRRLIAHWHTVLPPQTVLDVPYEGLVDEPELWSRKMIEFVGLDWDPAVLEFHRHSGNVSTFSKWQVRQKIHRGSVARWRNYESYVGPLLSLLE